MAKAWKTEQSAPNIAGELPLTLTLRALEPAETTSVESLIAPNLNSAGGGISAAPLAQHPDGRLTLCCDSFEGFILTTTRPNQPKILIPVTHNVVERFSVAIKRTVA